MNKWKKTVSIAILTLSIFLLTGCNESYQEVPANFEHEGNHISGSLVLPKNSQEPYPVVIFVHGDGAMPYDAYGYYRPLWGRLAERGIASFSWDKAGVGNSQGDWQSQSMDDRAEETVAAIEMLNKRADVAPNRIGLIGYSQAGWVLPLVASKSDYPRFMVLVSGAINWMDQGAYMTERRLTREGFSKKQIKQVIEESRNISAQLFSSTATYEEYLQYYHTSTVLKKMGEPLLAPQRFSFVKLNWRYDARESLEDIKVPTLAVFGKQDLNVDTEESIRVYKEMFEKSDNRNLTIKVFSDAGHGLLKQRYFKETIPGIGFLIKLEFLGEDAFTDGYLDFVADWIEKEIGGCSKFCVSKFMNTGHCCPVYG